MLSLRPNQSRAILATHNAKRAGHNRIIFVAPTGMGKRYCAVWWCQKAQEQGKQVLFVTNRRLLVEQMFKEASAAGVSYGVIMANTPAVDAMATVQIASLQTLRSRYFADRFGIRTPERMPPADLVLIDEAHQETESYAELLSYYPDTFTIGLTATPVGSQGRALTPPYDTLVEEVKNTELIRDGYLLPTKVYAPSEPNIEGVKVGKSGEFPQDKLGKKVQDCTVFADVFNEWAPFANRKTVCFCPGVAYARDLVRQFENRLGPDRAFLVTADTSTDEREEIFEFMRTGQGQVLVSVDVLREGFDLPELSAGIDLQPNGQLRTYWQKVGRVKRAFAGQTEAVWLDFAGNYWKFPHPDTDPDWTVSDEETTQERIEKRRKAGEEAQPITCPKCSLVRQAGRKCPGCGYEAGAPIRRIRMGNGKLKEIPAFAKKKREKSEAERQLAKWKSCIFGGTKRDATLHSAARLCYAKYGFWPKTGWPGVHADGSILWKQKVNAVFQSGKDIGIAFSQAERAVRGED